MQKAPPGHARPGLAAGIACLLAGVAMAHTALAQTTVPHGDSRDRLLATNACVKCDLAGVDLAGLNLMGADLSQADLSRANLAGAYLIGATLYQARLTGANLSGAVIGGANLSA
ncbi:MAG: pentapeptide repeat-containing protein, partial [Thiobacillus sp.]|nr:pentapeptide repeat-containing protein [Thiobacillus sp.]